MLVDIEREEGVSIHRFMSNHAIQEIRRISSDCERPHLQAFAVDFLVSVLESEAGSIDYLVSSGTIHHYLGLLATSDKLIFTKLINGLEPLLDYPSSVNRLAELRLVEGLALTVRDSPS
jgi:hypothetical protein